MAIVAVGSAVRPEVVSADLDLIVVCREPAQSKFKPPIEVDLRVYAATEIDDLIEDGNDMLGWAVKFGAVLYQRESFWDAVLGEVAASIANAVREGGLYGTETRSASRRPLVFVDEPAQTVASFHPYWSRITATLDRWPAIGRRELQAAMCSMTVVMLDELRQGPLKLPSAANQQLV